MAAIGIVGLGAMGGPMARRLAAQGLAPVVADPNPQTIQYYVARGGTDAAATPMGLAMQCELILLALPDEATLRDCVTGANGIVHGLRPGGLVVDLTGGEPETGAALARALVPRGAAWLEAVPVGTGKEVAAGALTLLVGGRPADIERARPVLEALAGRVVATGPVGSAALARSLAGFVAGAGLAALAEALAVARRAGTEPEAALAALAALAETAPLALAAPARAGDMFVRGAPQDYRLSRLLGEIDRFRDAARRGGAPAPLSATLREIAAASLHNLEGSDDIAALGRWVERTTRTAFGAPQPEAATAPMLSPMRRRPPPAPDEGG